MVDVPENIHVLEPHLQEINRKYVSEDPKLLYNNDWILVKETIVEYLKKDDVFRELFRQISYQGSTYENLKIGPRNEYDINIEMRLLAFYELEVDVTSSNPGFAKIKVGREKPKKPSERLKKSVEGWLIGDRYLCTSKILDWFKSVVDNALTAMKESDRPDISGITIVRRESGPAITLYVDFNREFSTDLVLALPFTIDKMPDKQKKILQRALEKSDEHVSKSIKSQVWYLVPKKPSISNIAEWRMSFYLYEKEIMNGFYWMKPVIKILKVMRDRRQWKQLSSYYIKTIFLWEMETNDHRFWSQNRISYIFFHMLYKLVEYLDTKAIEYYWDENCNLIKALDNDFLFNVKCFLCKRIEKLTNSLIDEDYDTAIAEFNYMFRHERSVDNSEEASNQSVRNTFVEGITSTFSDLVISGLSGGEASGIRQESLGFGDIFSRFVSNIENTLTPWKKQGIEENEGLIEGLDNGYSRPVNDQA
ncbi:hypothetical protein L9F63_003896, partial [Diploptera punctata]